jgi:hypothetical protein
MPTMAKSYHDLLGFASGSGVIFPRHATTTTPLPASGAEGSGWHAVGIPSCGQHGGRLPRAARRQAIQNVANFDSARRVLFKVRENGGLDLLGRAAHLRGRPPLQGGRFRKLAVRFSALRFPSGSRPPFHYFWRVAEDGSWKDAPSSRRNPVLNSSKLGWLTHMPLPAGDKLGPYEILALLGAGGMGEVYRARDTKLGRNVVLSPPKGHAISEP